MHKTFRCRENNTQIHDNKNTLQEIIYFMNDADVRHRILSDALQKNQLYTYLGTWILSYGFDRNVTIHPSAKDPFFDPQPNQSLTDFLQQKKHHFVQKETKKLFCVCIQYDGNRVHFVSFVYDPSKLSLSSFDSGIELYTHGVQTLIPIVQKAFRDAGFTRHTKSNIMGRCYEYKLQGKAPGIQYNGKKNTFPADAFCQSWSIFFLTKLIQDGNYSFIRYWCRVRPIFRERYIIKHFLLPTFRSNTKIKRLLHKKGFDYTYLMDILEKQTKSCA